MAKFDTWCSSVDTPAGAHVSRVMTGRADCLETAVAATAAAVPAHYASEEHIARLLTRLGKDRAAAYIHGKLPVDKGIRSGDLGEIYATEWIDAHSGGYCAPIKRLRWKDHQNMAMRGDDVVGLRQDPQTQRLHFIKTEAKSRATLTAQVIRDARAALDKDEGLPSAHALSFISERLFELGHLDLADAIDDAQRVHGIPPETVQHLCFIFSGNAPGKLMVDSLQQYAGPIAQWSVGLHVEGQVDFIARVYQQVMDDADEL